MRVETYQVMVFGVLLFALVGFGFVLVHLLAGMLVRPIKPDGEKLTIYECGEPTIGTAWIQFDLRFYVVALLFVIFDVEVAFFFPWAVVFGNATALAQQNLPEGNRLALSKNIATEGSRALNANERGGATEVVSADDARRLAWIAFGDIALFFGVLLVGFAYLWRRGDLDWVRSVTAEQPSLEPLPESVLHTGVATPAAGKAASGALAGAHH